MENEGETTLRKSAAHCLRQAALAAFVLLTAALALCALTLTARNEVGDNIMLQTVTLVREPLLRSLLLSLAALAVLLGMHGLLERLGGVRLGAGLCALWLAAALLWIWAIGMRQRADAQMVLADAHQFARNHYDALSGDYLQVCTYQLGIALPLHMLARLFSGATMGQLDFLAQCVNAALGIAGAGVLAALAQELLDRRAASATLLLYIASLPTLLFAQFVYNINLMILLGAGAMLCFARYVRTGRVGFGLAYAALAGLATVAKPNAEIVLLALFIQCCGVYQILLALLTRLNPLRFLKKFAPVMGFAFSTATSNATIPMNIDTLEEKIGVNRRISSFTIPLGATINMDGTSIMQGVAVVFVAQAFGIQLSPADYLTVIATATLASIGTAGVPSVGLVTLAMVFDSVGLPVAGIGLIMGIDRILDMARTAVNITGDAVCTTIVAHQDGALDKSVFNKN